MIGGHHRKKFEHIIRSYFDIDDGLEIKKKTHREMGLPVVDTGLGWGCSYDESLEKYSSFTARIVTGMMASAPIPNKILAIKYIHGKRM
ncbi:MAG: hypothetical protein Q8L47_03030 [bacterium]|nr:hypothetical protein [bacterium]